MAGTASVAANAALSPTGLPRAARIIYGEIAVEGVRIAYREAGRSTDPVILLLHGVPSSSRMFEKLMRVLGGRYRMVALDYPGFGNSEAPSPDRFAYTFDHLASTVTTFVDALGIDRFVLFMQDYGAPVGMRIALDRPEAIAGLIFQNGNVYEEGLSAFWEGRAAYWRDRGAHERQLLDEHLSLAGIRGRHLGKDPDITAYDPDLWMDEHAFLNRPGQAAVQAELIYDYRTNIDAYPAWQAWLRANRPPTLVMWGRHDPAFTTEGAQAFGRDLPDATIAILDAGHFAMDTKLDEVADLTDAFMREIGNPPTGER